MLQNETKQHFETRDLKGDAEKAQKKAYRVISKDAATRKARDNPPLGDADSPPIAFDLDARRYLETASWV